MALEAPTASVNGPPGAVATVVGWVVIAGAVLVTTAALDVVLPLVTGQTWLQVPETLLVEFVGEPAFGVGGKDIILQDFDGMAIGGPHQDPV